MLISDLWISLKQVQDEIFEHLSESNSDLGLFDLIGETEKLTWLYCKQAKEVRLYKPDGKTIKVPKSIVAPPDPMWISRENAHVSLSDGRLGSGSKREEIALSEDGLQTHHEYGPNLGLLIVFEKKDFRKYMKQLESGGGPPLSSSRNEIIKAILKYYHDGKHINKETTRLAVANHVSRNGFDLAWADAAEEESALKKPGKKK